MKKLDPASPRIPLLVFLLWSLWITVEYWVFADLSYLHIHDNADQLIPTYLWLTRSLDRLLGANILPILGGVDRLSSAASLHLFHLPFLLFPAWAANGVILVLQRFLLGFFTFRLLHDVFRLPRLLAITAGIAHTLVWMEHGEMRIMHGLNEAGFPLLLWALCVLPLTRRRDWFAVWGLGTFFGLSMDPVSALPFFLSTSLLCAGVLRADAGTGIGLRRLLGFVLVFMVGYLPWVAQNLMAVASNASGGHRGDWGAANSFLWDLYLLYRPAPGLLLRWSGALLLALLWLRRRPWQTREGRGVLLLLLIAWVPGPFLKALALQLREVLGILNGFDWTRFDRTLSLAMLSAAAFGVHSLSRRLPPVWPAVFLLGMCMQVSLAHKQTHWTGMSVEGRNWRAVFGNRELQALAGRLAQTTIPGRVVTAGAHHAQHPMFLLPYGMETLDGYSVLYPNCWQQLWGTVVAGVLRGDNELQGHFAWGSRLYLYHSRQPWLARIPALPFDDWYDSRLLSLAGVTHVVSRTPLRSAHLEKVPPTVTEQDRQEWVWRSPAGKILGYLRKENPGTAYHVYRNPDALPRVFSPASVEILPGWSNLVETIAQRSLSELATTVLLVEGEGAPTVSQGEVLQVTELSYEPDDVRVRTSGTQPGFLVHSSLWYPGWRCEIDGHPSPIHRAYGVFHLVQVPAGVHDVRFRYTPAYRW